MISLWKTLRRLQRKVVSIKDAATGEVLAKKEKESIARDTNLPNKHTKTISSEITRSTCNSIMCVYDRV